MQIRELCYPTGQTCRIFPGDYNRRMVCFCYAQGTVVVRVSTIQYYSTYYTDIGKIKPPKPARLCSPVRCCITVQDGVISRPESFRNHLLEELPGPDELWPWFSFRREFKVLTASTRTGMKAGKYSMHTTTTMASLEISVKKFQLYNISARVYARCWWYRVFKDNCFFMLSLAMKNKS